MIWSEVERNKHVMLHFFSANEQKQRAASVKFHHEMKRSGGNPRLHLEDAHDLIT